MVTNSNRVFSIKHPPGRQRADTLRADSHSRARRFADHPVRFDSSTKPNHYSIAWGVCHGLFDEFPPNAIRRPVRPPLGRCLRRVAERLPRLPAPPVGPAAGRVCRELPSGNRHPGWLRSRLTRLLSLCYNASVYVRNRVWSSFIVPHPGLAVRPAAALPYATAVVHCVRILKGLSFSGESQRYV